MQYHTFQDIKTNMQKNMHLGTRDKENIMFCTQCIFQCAINLIERDTQAEYNYLLCSKGIIY